MSLVIIVSLAHTQHSTVAAPQFSRRVFICLLTTCSYVSSLGGDCSRVPASGPVRGVAGVVARRRRGARLRVVPARRRRPAGGGAARRGLHGGGAPAVPHRGRALLQAGAYHARGTFLHH